MIAAFLRRYFSLQKRHRTRLTVCHRAFSRCWAWGRVRVLGLGLLSLALLVGGAWPRSLLAAPTVEFSRLYWGNERFVAVVEPQPGEGWLQLSERLLAEPEAYRAALIAFNRQRPLRTGVGVHLPVLWLQLELRGQALQSFYPDDELTERGWSHIVADPLETLLHLTMLFTDQGALYRQVARANGLEHPDVLPLGQEIVIPLRWIPLRLGLFPSTLPLRCVWQNDHHRKTIITRNILRRQGRRSTAFCFASPSVSEPPNCSVWPGFSWRSTDWRVNAPCR